MNNVQNYTAELEYPLARWMPVITAFAAKAPSFEDGVQAGLLALLEFGKTPDGQVYEVAMTYKLQQAILGQSRRDAEAGVESLSDLAPGDEEDDDEKIVLGSLAELADFTEMFDEVGDPLAEACDRLVDDMLEAQTDSTNLLMARKVYGLIPAVPDEELLEQYNRRMDAHKKSLRQSNGRNAAEYADESEEIWYESRESEDGDPADCLPDFAFYANLGDNPGAGGRVVLTRDEWDEWVGWHTETRAFSVAPFGEKADDDGESDADVEEARELGISVEELLDHELDARVVQIPEAAEARAMLDKFYASVQDAGANWWERAAFTRSRIKAILQGYGPEASKTIAFAANGRYTTRPFTVNNIVKVNGSVLFVTTDGRRLPVDRNQWPVVNVAEGKTLAGLAAALHATGNEQAQLLAKNIEQIRL